MARYEDYVKELEQAQNDPLEQEIQEAAADTAERVELQVPESVLKRFEGKTQEEVLNSYYNLEQKLSEQGHKMGELRKNFDEYILLQSQPSEPEPELDPVSVDDLYDNPEAVISDVVERKTKDKLSKLEDELQAVRRERALAEFERNHPKARELAASPDFIDWVQGSPYRLRLAQQADSFDLDAAEELFGLYEDSTSAHSKAATAAQRDKQLREATLESSSPATPSLDEVWSRAEIIDRKLRAKLGDQDSQVWLRKNNEAIAIAYEEGRVVD